MTRLDGVTVAFDLDGTLVDTAPDLARAMNHVLRAEGLPALPPETVRPLIGQGALALIRRGFAEAGQVLEEQQIPRLRDAFLDFYNENILVDSRLFEGVEETLETLRDLGVVAVICTNKPQALTLRLLGALQMTDQFAAIVGADAVPDRKPHPDHVLTAVARGGGSFERAVFVGDSETDEKAARGSGLPFLLYPHGYRSASVNDLAADAVFEHYQELPDLIRRFAPSA